jgi:predicted transcriptional regulator YdeE
MRSNAIEKTPANVGTNGYKFSKKCQKRPWEHGIQQLHTDIPMYTIEKTDSIRVVGLQIRTTNERAFQEIPGHWQRFFSEGTLSRIPDAVSDTVFAVYADFENEGKNNEGTYSFVIGAQVPDVADSLVPEGLVSVTIPSSKRAIFPVEAGHPERVGDEWRKIWSIDLSKTYVCDYERYDKSGDIHICVGVQ